MGLIFGFIILLAIFIIVNKFWCFWSRSKVCLVGRTAIVTGGASGIGYQTALALAAKGCRVIIADIANISEAVEGIIKETHNPNVIGCDTISAFYRRGKNHFVKMFNNDEKLRATAESFMVEDQREEILFNKGKKVDLQSFKSVREFANDILATEANLNILMCNAGIGEYADKIQTEDGIQKTMQVNYFSHFLLAHLLLDILKKSTPSRIVFTSSLLAYVSDLTIDTLNPKSEYLSKLKTKMIGSSYSNSKLALAAAAKVFGEKLKGTGVTCNAVHPGGVRTPIFAKGFKNEPQPWLALAGVIAYFYGKSPEEGAQTLIHLAHSDEVENITGQSFVEGMRVSRPFQLNNKDFCQKIWDESILYTKLEPHEVQC